MKVVYEHSIEYLALQLIEKVKRNVFLRQDFSGLGSYRQISRALKKLVKQGKLVRIGFGIYARAHLSKYLEEPLVDDGFDVVAREALNRIGVQWEPGAAEKEYNLGLSQQVPTQNVVHLKSRFRREISYAGRKLYYEGGVNAR